MENKYREARRHVERKIGFFIHLAVYLMVNGGLILFNLLHHPGKFWVFGPLFGWGIGLLFHGAAVFLISLRVCLKSYRAPRIFACGARRPCRAHKGLQAFVASQADGMSSETLRHPLVRVVEQGIRAARYAYQTDPNTKWKQRMSDNELEKYRRTP